MTKNTAAGLLAPKLHSVREENAAAEKAKPDEVRHPQEDCTSSHDGILDHNNNGTHNK